MTLWSWARVFSAPINRVVEATAMRTVDQLASECIKSIFDIVVRRRTERPLERNFLTVRNVGNVEPWRSLLAGNTPGPLPPDVPVFLAQGLMDKLVRPEVTLDYMAGLCRGGSVVRMFTMANVNHGYAAHDSAGAAVNWITDRFAGFAAPNDCGASGCRSHSLQCGIRHPAKIPLRCRRLTPSSLTVAISFC